jgi:hypothetical protein
MSTLDIRFTDLLTDLNFVSCLIKMISSSLRALQKELMMVQQSLEF